MAMCLVWFKKIFQSQYKDVSWDMKEDIRTAKQLQLQYMMRQRGVLAMERKMEMFANNGMTFHGGVNETKENDYFGNFLEQNGAVAEKWIKTVPELTCFAFGLPAHATGGFSLKEAAFYFDPNLGVYELNNINDFAVELLDSIYENYFKDTDGKYIGMYKVHKGVS